MQQINLYQEGLKKQKLLISFNNSLIAASCLILFTIIIQSHAQYTIYSSQQKIESLESTLANKTKELEKYKASLPTAKKDLSLNTKLSQLEKKLIHKQNILDTLSGRKLGNTEGFSAYFEALAKQTIDGLWLTKLHFLEGGTQLDIQGRTNTPSLVPKYLLSLSTESIFNGTEFNSFILNKGANQSILDFKLNNLPSPNSRINLSQR